MTDMTAEEFLIAVKKVLERAWNSVGVRPQLLGLYGEGVAHLLANVRGPQFLMCVETQVGGQVCATLELSEGLVRFIPCPIAPDGEILFMEMGKFKDRIVAGDHFRKSVDQPELTEADAERWTGGVR